MTSRLIVSDADPASASVYLLQNCKRIHALWKSQHIYGKISLHPEDEILLREG